LRVNAASAVAIEAMLWFRAGPASSRQTASVNAPDNAVQLIDGAPVLVGDIGHGELDVPKRGAPVGVAYHALQDRQAHARARHVSAEGVAEPVRVRSRDRMVTTTLAKQAPQSGHRHRTSTTRPLQNDEQPWRRAVGRPFPSHVVGDGRGNHVRQRQDTVALTFATDAELPVFVEYVAPL
jgi:hypothetical protein